MTSVYKTDHEHHKRHHNYKHRFVVVDGMKVSVPHHVYAQYEAMAKDMIAMDEHANGGKRYEPKVWGEHMRSLMAQMVKNNVAQKMHLEHNAARIHECQQLMHASHDPTHVASGLTHGALNIIEKDIPGGQILQAATHHPSLSSVGNAVLHTGMKFV